MSIQVQVALRSKKLGVLMRDGRLASHKTLSECAELVGFQSDNLHAWEEGRKSPSLPELEVLACSLNLPLQHFWGKKAASEVKPLRETINLPVLIELRQHLIGALLRKQREKVNISLKALSEHSGITVTRLKAYEMGDWPIPLPELEGLISMLGGQIEDIFDQTGPIGEWIVQQNSVQDFLKLPREAQNFICDPVNRPYLDLAMKFSNLSADRLRSIAQELSERLSLMTNNPASQDKTRQTKETSIRVQ
jgi:transcriptional regulator with XRE-family HTH domain